MELSQREWKIAELISRGLQEEEIGEKLFISRKTVHNHAYNIRKKWKARSAVDVARMFILKLENPKKFFAALSFLLIQSHIIFSGGFVEWRRPSAARTKICRTYKPSRKYYC